MNHTQVIQHFINQIDAKTYLEIGGGDLSNFNAIICADKTVIDPKFVGEKHDSEGCHFYGMESNLFFNTVATDAESILPGYDGFDVIFIDGLHHADQVRSDIENAIACLSLGGVVLVHDINPASEEMTLVPRQTKQWTGDVYKAWYAFNRRVRGADIKMLADDFGIGIIIPGPDFKLTKEPVKNITFNEYRAWIEKQFTQL